MAAGRGLGRLILCVSLVISLRAADGYPVDITYVESAVAKGAGILFFELSKIWQGRNSYLAFLKLIFPPPCELRHFRDLTAPRFPLRQCASTGARRRITSPPASGRGRTAGSSRSR